MIQWITGLITVIAVITAEPLAITDSHLKMVCVMVCFDLLAAVLQNILNYISYKFFKISLQIYVIVLRNIKKTSYFLLWKQTLRFSAIGIFLLYITATALVTQLIMQRKVMFYQRFVNWIKGSVIIDFSTEHDLTSIYYRKL